MNSIIKSSIKVVKGNKIVSSKQMVSSINKTCPELNLTEKQLNEYLYNESYSDNKLYSSCESLIFNTP